MTELEQFDIINRKCECVSILIQEAEATDDPGRAESLYKKAAQVTDSLVKDLDRRMIPCDAVLAIISDAA